jgi:8-oxo-dGTP pyrophosphatase MutT (NUDIX family)
LGGHCDGDFNPLRVAQREAMEESGLEVIPIMNEVFDLDIHEIPVHGDEPAHYHYDVRFALQVKGSDAYRISGESLDLRWVQLDEVPKYNSEESILRMIHKIRSIAR